MSGNRQIYLDSSRKVLKTVPSASCFAGLDNSLIGLKHSGESPRYLSYQLSDGCLNTFWKEKENRKRFVDFVKSLYHFSELEFECDKEYKTFTIDLEKISGFDTFALFVALRYMEEFGKYSQYLFNYVDNFKLSSEEAFIVFHYLGLDGNSNHLFYGDTGGYRYCPSTSQSLFSLLKYKPKIPNQEPYLKDIRSTRYSLWKVFSPIRPAVYCRARALKFLLVRTKNKKKIRSIEDVEKVLKQI